MARISFSQPKDGKHIYDEDELLCYSISEIVKGSVEGALNHKHYFCKADKSYLGTVSTIFRKDNTNLKGAMFFVPHHPEFADLKYELKIDRKGREVMVHEKSLKSNGGRSGSLHQITTLPLVLLYSSGICGTAKALFSSFIKAITSSISPFLT